MICANCHYDASSVQTWIGDASSMDYARNPHGWPQWCHLCIAQAQLRHAEAQAAMIKPLRLQIQLLLAERPLRADGTVQGQVTPQPNKSETT